MRMELYIVELLYRYNCVIVPELGAFLTNTASAVIEADTKLITPPTKKIAFNEQLSKNDGLLVSYIAKVKRLPYDDMLEQVLITSNTWKEKMLAGEKLQLEGIGQLGMNASKKIEFTPENQHNYLLSSFGFVPVSATPINRETLKAEVEQLESKAPLKFTPERRKKSTFIPWAKYAALVLLTATIGTTGYLISERYKETDVLVQEQVDNEVVKYIQEATFFDNDPLTFPALKIKVEKKEDEPKGPRYYIIAGAFREKTNADKKINQLENKGFKAEYAGENRFGLHQVAFAGYASKKEALQNLRSIKRTVSSDAWLLATK
ncbi:hypothetical protein GCM10011414_05800 [Croceivirga lutea]|uniref:HU domain-containing protein n=1 Tax=Croceivirga lutea TaxID=1775167 RepID=UPI00163A18A2|nr:SPOR domain-containing protein [Croceivirga lutea]GGG39297.1 hypothetical protein GCM10011414_05800 [Croceivirga lutea]